MVFVHSRKDTGKTADKLVIIRIYKTDCVFVSRRISKLYSKGLLDSFDSESYDSELTKQPFTGKSNMPSELVALVHTDVCGPFSMPTRG